MKVEFAILAIFGVIGQICGYSLFFQQDADVVQEKVLSQDEENLANQARADIAEVIENNLVRIFAIITAQKERNYEDYLLVPRQDEDGDGFDIDIVTPNPNVLPQVAQILGAIFGGTLNITRIADGTVGLVPNFLRNQLQGLVKLLTGETVNLTGSTSTTTTPTPSKGGVTTEVDVVFEEEPSSSSVVASASAPALPQPQPSSSKGVVAVTTENVNLGAKNRYRVRNRTKRTTTVTPQKPSVDDEIDRIERDLRAAASILEPYEHREPRFYAELFTTVMENVNMTEITKAVPSLFKGATQAFVMLENLGVVDTLPGADLVAQVQDIVEDEEEE